MQLLIIGGAGHIGSHRVELAHRAGFAGGANEAHPKQPTPRSTRYNLGNGQGFSVKQVIDTAHQVTGREIRLSNEARRPGDPARLVANSNLVRQALGWQGRPELVRHRRCLGVGAEISMDSRAR